MTQKQPNTLPKGERPEPPPAPPTRYVNDSVNPGKPKSKMSTKALLDRFQLACVNYGKFPSAEGHFEMCKWYDEIVGRIK